MQAVVLHPGTGIRLDDVERPVAGPGEVLVRVGAAGICGTDLHAPDMPALFAQDVVLGHEFGGTIVELGPGVEGLAAGQDVVVNPIALACHGCEACVRGLTNQCLTALTQTCGVARPGGMAEFVSVDARAVHVVPAGLPLAQAVWTEPLAVALRGVGHAGLRAGDRVAVLGAGAIGQLSLQVALNAGAAEVLVVEPSPLRRTIAARCGATRAVGPDELGAVEQAYDAVLDCTGAPAAFGSAQALVAPGGRIVVLGAYTEPILLTSIAREATVVFSSVYRDDREFAAALRLLARGLIDTGPLTTAVLPLSRHAEAFAALRSPEASVKIFLDPRS